MLLRAGKLEADRLQRLRIVHGQLLVMKTLTQGTNVFFDLDQNSLTTLKNSDVAPIPRRSWHSNQAMRRGSRAPAITAVLRGSLAPNILHAERTADAADVVSWLIWIKEEGQTRPTVTAERMEHRHESQRH